MFWSIIWLILTTDKTSVVTCEFYAVMLNIFLMCLNWSSVVFSVIIYSSIYLNQPNHFVISYGFNTSSLNKYSGLNYGQIFLISQLLDCVIWKSLPLTVLVYIHYQGACQVHLTAPPLTMTTKHVTKHFNLRKFLFMKANMRTINITSIPGVINASNISTKELCSDMYYLYCRDNHLQIWRTFITPCPATCKINNIICITPSDCRHFLS